MKKMSYFIFIVFFGLTGCNGDESISKEQEFESLQRQFEEITAIAESVSCDDSKEWTFTYYGSKACGGPTGYIAYSLTIDTTAFLKQIEVHRKAQEKFNLKWGIISDCGITPAPIDVSCENGVPVLLYQ